MTAATTATPVREAPLDVRALWRRVRWPVLLVGGVLAVAVLLAVVQNAPPQRPLDPRDASPVGARALAQLLRDRGVDVRAVPDATGLAPDPGTTVFVPDPQSLPRTSLEALAASSADVLVIAPSSRELDALGVTAVVTGGVGERTLAPGCSWAVAQAAGDVRFAGLLYRSAEQTGCYAEGAGAGLVTQSRAAGGTVAVFGSALTFSNKRLGDNGDAALALGLLSGRPRVAWLLPQPPSRAPADAGHKSLVRLLPPRLLWTVLQLVLVVVVVGLWRARRLGAVVVEPLPVVVRAAETVEGRARLLRAARARGTAARALRTATAARLRDVVGVGPDAAPAALVESVARRTGRAGAEVERLLYGADPPDDATLVRLADDLDELEQSVRSS